MLVLRVVQLMGRRITSSLNRAVLERHCNSITVHATHEQTKQAAYRQKLIERCAVDGGDLQQPKHEHIDDHGPLAAPLVTSKAKEESPDRAKKQCKGDGSGDLGLRNMEVLGQLHSLDAQCMEVEGIG